MTHVFAVLVILCIFAIPVLGIIFFIRWGLKKPKKKLGIAWACTAGGIVIFTLLGTATDPATWCEHEYTLVSETAATCTEDGERIEHCDLCEHDKIEKLAATGHTMVEVLREEPGEGAEGQVVTRCSVCGYEHVEPLEAPEASNTPVISSSAEDQVRFKLFDFEKEYLLGQDVAKTLNSPYDSANEGKEFQVAGWVISTIEKSGFGGKNCVVEIYTEDIRVRCIAPSNYREVVAGIKMRDRLVVVGVLDDVTGNGVKLSDCEIFTVDMESPEIVRPTVDEVLQSYGIPTEKAHDAQILLEQLGITDLVITHDGGKNGAVDTVQSFMGTVNKTGVEVTLTFENDILYYVSCYGTDMYDEYSGEVWVPLEQVNIPDPNATPRYG